MAQIIAHLAAIEHLRTARDLLKKTTKRMKQNGTEPKTVKRLFQAIKLAESALRHVRRCQVCRQDKGCRETNFSPEKKSLDLGKSRLRMGLEMNLSACGLRGETALSNTFQSDFISVSAINPGRRWRRRKRISERDHETNPTPDIVAAVVSLVNVGRQITLDDDRS